MTAKMYSIIYKPYRKMKIVFETNIPRLLAVVSSKVVRRQFVGCGGLSIYFAVLAARCLASSLS